MNARFEPLFEINDLRTVWSNEALDFTPWLAREENLSLLATAVNVNIVSPKCECPVGDFKVDIVAAEAGTNRKVIIENQLEETNHDHLGKLLTYAAGQSADIVIWLVRRAREEHKAAIKWLNKRTDGELWFFLCEIKLLRVGDSAPAVKFETVECPNEWKKEVRPNERGKPRHRLRLEYWSAFNEYAFADADFSLQFVRRVPSKNSWLDFGIGASSCRLSVDMSQKNDLLRVGLYIPNDKNLFNSLLDQKGFIEAELGFPLKWRELPERKASRISVERPADFADRSAWKGQFEWITGTALKVKSAFVKYL